MRFTPMQSLTASALLITLGGCTPATGAATDLGGQADLAAAPDLANPPTPDERVRVDIGTHTAMAGEDFLEQCIPRFPTDVPIAGDFYQTGFEAHIMPVLHHIQLYPLPTSMCGGPPTGDLSLLAAAQQTNAVVHLPDGVALHYKGITGVGGSIHLINATRSPITISGYVDLLHIEKDQVKTMAGEFLAQNQDIHVAPGHMGVITGVCHPPKGTGDIHIPVLMYHVHKHFVAASGGLKSGVEIVGSTNERLLTPTAWDSGTLMPFPNADHPGEILLKAGDALKYTCIYQNDNPDNADLVFGTDADQDMCGFMAWYYVNKGDTTDVPFMACINDMSTRQEAWATSSAGM